ncbi:hypothetical protein OC835_003612 [Tilletia horrida]|nr:hypothetical protein OC835_003612 [Tilletia horrida]
MSASIMAKLQSLLPGWLSAYPAHYTVPLALLLSPLAILLATAIYFGSLVLWRVVEREILHSDQYAHLKSPKFTSLWWPFIGHIDHIIARPPADGHLDFLNEVQIPVFLYKIFNFQTRLFITDPVAIAYLLSSAHNYDYPKPEGSRRFLTMLLGEGLVSAEGEAHKRARRVLQPAFSLASIRNLTPLFFRHANHLSTKLAEQIDRTEGPASTAFMPGQTDISAEHSKKGAPVINIMHWLGLTTMDVIGEAGFGYHFNALQSAGDDSLKEDAIAGSFTTLTSNMTGLTIFQILLFVLGQYPIFRWLERIPTQRRRLIRQTYSVLESTSQKIIDQKRADVLREMEVAALASNETGGATKEFFEDLQQSGAPKDLMHLMLRANLASDLPPTAKLHDHELLGQITTLLLAGQETTSTQLTWCLWTLAQPRYQPIQQQLRRELRELFAGREEVRYEELQGLRLLDKVTLEIMRLISAVPSTTRVANKDDVIPLGAAYPTRNGRSTFDHLPIKRGTEIFILIQVLNRDPRLWGDDADDFVPDRWDHLPDPIRELTAKTSTGGGVPTQGLWTFIAGPRSCIGRAFAITEFKCILAVLLRDLQFDLVADWEVERKQGIVVRPRIKGQEKLGMQMPLRVSRAA